MKTIESILVFACLCVAPLHAKKTHSFRTEAWTPQEELAGFELLDGFVIELVASEEDGIINPIDLAFDDTGRLWTQTAIMYPLDPFAEGNFGVIRNIMEEDPDYMESNPEFDRIRALYEGRVPGEDKILIIDDPYAEDPTEPRVWADGLANPQSILPYKNGAYVAQGSELFFLIDSDGDGRADERKRLLTGFGYLDSHTMSHLLIRGPGGWIHFSHGALNKGEVRSLVSGATAKVEYSKIVRMSLDGSRFNVVSAGLNNIWGFQLRADGQWYASEANDKSWSAAPIEPGTAFQGIGSDRLRPYQPFIPEMHKFRVGGTGLSGLAFAEDQSNSFPDGWEDVALLANPITNSINCVRVVRNPDGSVTAEHLTDLLKSEDDWFRPVNLEFGPDGSLYVADWYNKIISHNEVPRSNPDRDKSHGRIWRIRHESQEPKSIPNLYDVENAELVAHLQSPSLWEKRAAWHQIADRGANELAPQLVALAGDAGQDVITRIHALWSLESLGHFDTQLMHALLESPEDALRRETVRALGSFEMPPSQMAKLLEGFVEDPNAMVRAQALRALAEYGKANQEIIDILTSFSRPELAGDTLGGPYERRFERYLARKALEQYPSELEDYLNTSLAESQPVAHRFWAIQALPEGVKTSHFVSLLGQLDQENLDESTFVAVASSLENRQIRQAADFIFKNPEKAEEVVKWSLDKQARLQSPDLIRQLETPTRNLLSSEDEARKQLGLRAVERFRVPGLQKRIAAIAKATDSNAETKRLAIEALQSWPEQHSALFSDILADEEAPFNLRLASLAGLIQAEAAPSESAVERMTRKANREERAQLINALSTTAKGSLLLLDLIEAGAVSEESFDRSAAERMLEFHPENERAQTLSAALKQRAEREKKAFAQKLDEYVKIAANESGDPKSGDPLFESLCLSCHVVGSEGVGIAPALDGSGYRDHEGLLTAILEPNAAIEPAYFVHRVVRSDGSIIEGYLEKSDERGTTLRFMGGGELFIPSSDIKSERKLPDRSFMPQGLIDQLSTEQVADLLAYIDTLK